MARSSQKPDLSSNLALAAGKLVDARSQLQQGAMEDYSPAQHELLRGMCAQAQGLMDEVAALIVSASLTDADLTALFDGGAPS